MAIKDLICKSFCNGFNVIEVPMGFAIKSPNNWLDGEPLIFYCRKNGDVFRIEESGSSIFDLETAGVDTKSLSRAEIITKLQNEHDVKFDTEEVLFHGDWVTEEKIGLEAVKFLAFMTRLQDLSFTTKERVANTFKQDLLSAINDRFRNIAIVDTNEAPVENLNYYKVDIIVKSKSGKVAAIFPCTSEQSALEAVLFSKELELKNIDNVIPFLIFDNDSPNKIGSDTHTKAINSDLNLGAWANGNNEAIDKVEKRLRA